MNDQNLFDFNDDAIAAPETPVSSAAQAVSQTGANGSRDSESQATLRYLLCYEGLEVSLDAQMAMNDDAIREAFKSSFPGIATLHFTRAISNGVLRITGVKEPTALGSIDGHLTGSAPDSAPIAPDVSADVGAAAQLTYLLCIEGRELPIDAETAADDEHLKAALSTAYPEATTAEVTRTTKDGMQRITVIKRGGPKGTGARNRKKTRRVITRLTRVAIQSDEDEGWRIEAALGRLIVAPRRFNPLIATHFELERQRQAGQLDLLTLMMTQGQIERALIEGPKEAQQMGRALTRLIESPATAWQRVPVGF
jgi:hypothetical protein